jgi:Flp pilus assembly protein TadG
MVGPTHRRHRKDDRGAATYAVIIGVALLTITLIAMLNFITFQYGRGSLRTIADQAAQAGSRASATVAICEQRAKQSIDALIGGPLGDNATVTCTDDGQRIEATATATFQGWLPIVPDQTVVITATAVKEHAP